MPTDIVCISCGRQLRVPVELVGQLVRCPECAFEFTATVDSSPPTTVQWTPDAAPPLPICRNDATEFEDRGPSRAGEHRFQKHEPAALPSPRLDDLRPRDEFDEVPRRRSEFADRDYVALKLRGPANGLLIVAIIDIIILAVRFGTLGVVSGDAEDLDDEQVLVLVLNGVCGLAQLACSILIICGAQRMKRVDNYGLAMAAAIIAMIPFASPCCLLGIPLGWRAMSALRQPDVIAVFGRVSQSQLKF